MDDLRIGGRDLRSRLFMGTGKFASLEQMGQAITASGAQVVTVALRRADLTQTAGTILDHIPRHCTLMPNTSGARTAEEAVRIARLAKASGCGNWIKIEIIPDQKYLLPDNAETVKATEILAAEGFVVLPYMVPDLVMARRMQAAGAAAVMPLGAPIGSNRGFKTREMVRLMIEEMDLPVIVDAGIGRPSEAAEVMEMGGAAVLVNTAVATAADPALMAEAFGMAVAAGRKAWLAGPGRILEGAEESSPLTGFLGA